MSGLPCRSRVRTLSAAASESTGYKGSAPARKPVKKLPRTRKQAGIIG
ncbi:MAG: hypothetical protein AVDCRST_MAG56-1848 [uncultured Cytophagales bacterium]|uniref:Uncharacterized protein n=1 Tax=uncultured Cytophagales bacterium TaxID=158755 RepID=A0A6J4IGC2_9SPHI|nr:MAG: hypothetical protein AVDCRST_MAG56-1848 [uncultured Cytophagales bacterium]